ncbi:hypothetical protein DFQ01_14126 [Paenibacillus cellulosilyticus]|uniref:Butirosin biosynthesis protein H-like n=1 Tax=Paenibacillus cellulosilyticus TaxID=375489 RepID=A0A2V2YNE6_9BACL|nr:hypothetical protein [Paenibacillus cellulosilyticus]PWV90613.1 hypothetical protein DFQ01_14126 [Paenibacillus cellulosilyticus]QKS45223.1 hypothetical protein HUB94_12965 [Paenibacillus cellulosilyticus]
MSLKLPITMPKVYGYKHHALPLSVITQEEQGVNWMLNNYLQLYTRYGWMQDSHWLEFYLTHNILDLPHNPFLHVQKIKLDLIKDMDLSVLFRNALENETYIYAWYDPKFFESNNPGLSINNFLVYGFDEDRKKFNILDYDYNKSHQLSQMEIGFEEMNQSINNLAFPEDWSTHLYFISLKKRIAYTFDYVLASQLLQDYINAEKTVNRLRMNVDRSIADDAVFGIKVYDSLLACLEMQLENDKHLSLLPFQILYEHKQCILLLVRFLNRHYQINEELSLEIMNTTLAFRNMIMKYFLTQDNKIIRNIMSKIPRLIEIETNNIESILHAIQNESTISLSRL